MAREQPDVSAELCKTFEETCGNDRSKITKPNREATAGENIVNYDFLSSPTLLENERFIDEHLNRLNLADKNILNQPASTNINSNCNDNYYDRYINHLEKEVMFLRGEVSNKNTIINLLCKDLKNSHLAFDRGFVAMTTEKTKT